MLFRQIREEEPDQRTHFAGSHMDDARAGSDLHDTGPERHHSDHGNAQRHGLFRRVQGGIRDILHFSVKCSENNSDQDHSGPQIVQHTISPSPTYTFPQCQTAPVRLPVQPHGTLFVKILRLFPQPSPSSVRGIPRNRYNISDSFPAIR